jgi:hypothetical protein
VAGDDAESPDSASPPRRVRHDPRVTVRQGVTTLVQSLLGQNDPIEMTPRQAHICVALLYGMGLAVLLFLVGLATLFVPLGVAAALIWIADPLVAMSALAGSISRGTAYDSLGRRGQIWIGLLLGIYLRQAKVANQK